MKTYFDDEEDEVEGNSPETDFEAAEMLLSPRGGPSSREELITYIPEKHISDRLIMRYFSSSSPSQRKFPYQNQATLSNTSTSLRTPTNFYQKCEYSQNIQAKI